jgi:hypothetical protein
MGKRDLIGMYRKAVQDVTGIETRREIFVRASDNAQDRVRMANHAFDMAYFKPVTEAALRLAGEELIDAWLEAIESIPLGRRPRV